MATIHRKSKIEEQLPDAGAMKFGVVVSQWNPEVTNALLAGCVKTLRAAGCAEHNIIIKYVPGCFELPLGAQFFAQYTDVDAVIVLGCVVQGETKHFDYVCMGVTQGISRVMIDWNMPIIFGVLTTDNQQQALDRVGGKHGHKGDQAAIAAIDMVRLQNDMDPLPELNGKDIN